MKIKINNWTYLPSQLQAIDTFLPADDSLSLKLKIQASDYLIIFCQDSSYRLFVEPGSYSRILFSNGLNHPEYSGNFIEINNFLLKRNVLSDWRPRAHWYQGGGSVAEMLKANDSITLKQKEEVLKEEALPEWYKKYEIQRLEYNNVQSKLGSVVYRNKILSIKDSLSENLLIEVIKEINVENENFLGVTAYSRFLSNYLNFKIDPLLKKDIPRSMEEWHEINEKRISNAKEYFSNVRIRDHYLGYLFSRFIDTRPNILKSKWIRNIQNEEIKSILKDQLNKRPLLSKGDAVPYFYLFGTDSSYYEPKDFAGKILLLNFWATWCKPCFKEFSHENELVENFKGKGVEIVNICIDSEQNKWHEVLDEYDLKTTNLYANETWSEKINEQFGTVALPHSTLIDKNGKVIMNKCPRPSEGLQSLIDENLKMKTELIN